MVVKMKHPIMGFEHLHRHSHFSLLDGFATCDEYAARMLEINQKYLCITDHGVMGTIPEQITACDENKLFPIFGCELYVNPMQPKVANRDESAEFRKSLGDGSGEATPLQKKFDKSNHLLAIAYNVKGYSNLVRMTSWAWIHGYYRRPRVNHDVLNQYKEGIIFTSTCANSEIAQSFFEGGDDDGFAMVEKYMAMFGDKFYLELMMLDYKMQKPYDDFLLRAHLKYGLPLILSQDCFVAGTLVSTDKGLKKIEDVVAGDRVYTHKGRLREVQVVGTRLVRNGESVYRVKTRLGTYAFEATGNHKVYVANQVSKNEWKYDWKTTESLTTDDFLLIKKMGQEQVFSAQGTAEFDLLDYLSAEEYQVGDNYKSSHSGNMGCSLQYHDDKQEFVSYKGWDRKNKTVVPRKLPIREDLLKVIGWYLAEGWSEDGSNQVGFALHKKERSDAEFIMAYFAQFGIESKIYDVSENGIAVRFSSVVFNKFFSRLCGKRAGNKHLPVIGGTWMRVWTKQQLMSMLHTFWRGDGSGDDSSMTFASTSKSLIFEIATVLNAINMCVMPTCESGREENWSDCWRINLGSSKATVMLEWFVGKSVDDFQEEEPRGKRYIDLGQYWAVQIVGKEIIQYSGLVYDFQVEEDHSFLANTWVSSNCHYCKKEHSHNQMLMLLQKGKHTLATLAAAAEQAGDDGETPFEMQDKQLYLKSEEDLNLFWENTEYKDIIDYELFKQAKANTVKIAEFAKGVKLDREIKLPKIPDAEAKLWDEVKKGFIKRGCPKNALYSSRIREEYELITEKGFASYFLIQKMMTDEARDYTKRVLGFDPEYGVGPGRGSVCGSLLAYCLRLHDLDPLVHDLRFSRFLSPARGGKQTRFRHSINPVPHGSIAA